MIRLLNNISFKILNILMDKKIIFFILGMFFIVRVSSQEVFQMPDNISTRWASAENWKGEKGKGGMKNGGRKGSPCYTLKSGNTQILAESQNSSGIIRRIWITIDKRNSKMLRGIQIEMFWDGATTPAVSAPLGDFFGQGLGEMRSFENEFFSSPEGRSFNCYFEMPFRKSMKVQVKNSTDEDVTMFYEIDYTLGDKLPKTALYFHAVFNHKERTGIREDFEILPRINGEGRFMGTNISYIPNQVDYGRFWWGEGEVKIYLDGDRDFPTLCGTGTEDYIGSGWGFGEYAHRYQGGTISNGKDMRFAFYRYHVPDPVYFYSDIRVTIQQIGGVEGANQVERLSKMKGPIIRTGEKPDTVDFSKPVKGFLFERSDDVACCSYFYLKGTENEINKSIIR
jgi:hypothetical protein